MKFESTGSLRTYILNRPEKLNALDENMLSILRPKIEVLIFLLLYYFLVSSRLLPRNGANPTYVVQLWAEVKVEPFALEVMLRVSACSCCQPTFAYPPYSGVMRNAKDPATIPAAVDFFKKE